MSKKQPLVNAGKIIERFGGIRPMAAKIDTPVTTVQGWKKRDVIPGARREKILSAAKTHNINIEDLASIDSSDSSDSSAGVVSAKKMSAKKPTVKKESVKKVVSKATPDKTKSKEKTQKQKTETNITPAVSSLSVEKLYADSQAESNHSKLISEIEENNRNVVVTSAWVATGLILLAGAVALYLFWPHFQKNKNILNKQGQQLVSLEDKVEEVQIESKKKFLGTSLPDNLQEKIDGLQNQARNISVTVDQLSERAKEISTETLGATAQDISERLATLETKVETLSGPDGSYAGLVARIRDLENTRGGQEQLQNSANQLRSMIQGEYEDLNNNLAGIQNKGNDALGQTLNGVQGQDLKAAAILIAFSQFRSSLDREAPFEKDLALLQKLVGDDNPELQENLTRLSKHADGGVLTTSGLASELKRMTGDIVVSSLKGEDVSIKEKAKARFGDIVRIEKDGEMVSGTQTQATVAKAQEYIEQGNIADSISALEGLEGEAAIAAQPFINQATTALLADKVKAMLNETILSQAGDVNGLQGLKAPNISNLNLNEMKKNAEKAIPFLGGKEVVRDDESGFVVLPKSSGEFKGLFDNQ